MRHIAALANRLCQNGACRCPARRYVEQQAARLPRGGRGLTQHATVVAAAQGCRALAAPSRAAGCGKKAAVACSAQGLRSALADTILVVLQVGLVFGSKKQPAGTVQQQPPHRAGGQTGRLCDSCTLGPNACVDFACVSQMLLRRSSASRLAARQLQHAVCLRPAWLSQLQQPRLQQQQLLLQPLELLAHQHQPPKHQLKKQLKVPL